jgi:hypothetical protein
MAVSSASEVQIGPVLRIAGLIKEPVNAVGVDCFHVRHTFLEFSLCLCSGSPLEQVNQIGVFELFVHVILEMAEAKRMRQFREQTFDSFDESFLAI